MVFSPRAVAPVDPLLANLRNTPTELDLADMDERAQLTLTRWPSHYLPGAAPPSHRLVCADALDVLAVIDLCTLGYTDTMHMALRTIMGLENNVGEFEVHVIVLVPHEWLDVERSHRILELTNNRPPHVAFRGVIGTRADIMAAHYTHALHALADDIKRRRQPYTQTFFAFQARALDEVDTLLEAILAPMVNKRATHLCDAFSVHVLATQLHLTEEDGRAEPRSVPPLLIVKRAIPVKHSDAAPARPKRRRDAPAVAPAATRYYDLGRRRAVVDSGAGVGLALHDDL